MKRRYTLLILTVVLSLLLSLILPACAAEEPAPAPAPTPTPTPKPTPAPEPELGPCPDQEEVQWRFSSAFTEGDASGIILKDFMGKVTERTGGKITFDPYWACALGAPPEQTDLVKTGAVDIALYTRWYTPGKYPMSGFQYCFPFSLTDPSDCVKVSRQIYGEFPAFAAELEVQNQMILIHLSNGEFDFLTNKPVTKLEDFEGMRILLLGRFVDEWIAASGATPVAGAFATFYEMLQGGVADGARTTISFLDSIKTTDHCKYYPQMNQGTVNCISVMCNLDSFNALTPEAQEILVETALEAEAGSGDIVKAFEADVLKKWKDLGVEFTVFPEAERIKWINAMPDSPADLATEYEGKGLPGWAVVDRYLELAEELGHKWPRKWAQR